MVMRPGMAPSLLKGEKTLVNVAAVHQQMWRFVQNNKFWNGMFNTAQSINQSNEIYRNILSSEISVIQNTATHILETGFHFYMRFLWLNKFINNDCILYRFKIGINTMLQLFRTD